MKSWTEILINQSETIFRAIQVLNTSGSRIVLVVDDFEKLVGVITDGDIRRSLLKQLNMDSPVSTAMNPNPFTVKNTQNLSSIRLMMKSNDLLSVPIVDDENKIVGLESIQNLLGFEERHNPVFLMAGGFGKRLHPLTNDKPKPMLPLGDRPILEAILLQFIEEGFYNFFISVHFKADVISDYFGDGSKWGVTINYIHEKKPLGTAGALGLLPDNLTKLPMIMMNGDILTKVNFKNLLSFHEKNNCLATMCVREYGLEIPYGVVETDNGNITSIIEKPVKNFFVNAGIYVLDPALIHKVDGSSCLDMPELIQSQLSEGECISAFPIHEYWIDIGRNEDYKRANNASK